MKTTPWLPAGRAVLRVLLLLLALPTWPAVAQPYRPTDDGEILERLPRSATGGAVGELRALRQALSASPEDLELAAELARRAIALGRGSGDPRYYGYAQAALAPWWQATDPPLEVLLLRATIRQSRHDFAGAVEDLDRALALEPFHAGAWMTRAIVLQVQGKPREAMESCRQLARLDGFAAGACAGTVAGSLGKGEEGYALLVRTLVQYPEATPALQRWAVTSMAEIADRLGWTERAEAHFRTALDLQGAKDSDIYLRAAFADFLLDEGRPEEVVEFLAGEEQADALLLRRALAAHRLGDPSAEVLSRRLADRYAAARQRGSSLHRGLEARFVLEVQGDPARALALALENWRSQREPVDARIVLAAASAAGKPEAAAPVLEWLEETGLQDRRLERFLRESSENPPPPPPLRKEGRPHPPQSDDQDPNLPPFSKGGPRGDFSVFPLALWERGTEGVRALHRAPGFTPGATEWHPGGCGTKTVSGFPPFSKGGVLPGGLGDFCLGSAFPPFSKGGVLPGGLGDFSEATTS